ncbi:MAG TPA: DNA polymerase IV [Wenzhouxiangella sp.]
MNQPLIIHVDMDAFFTSVEQNDNPSLRGRPVMVGGARRRGVVAAASYEARQYGVRSAMPASVARRLCPEGHFLPSRMARYREISEQIFQIFSCYSEVVEGISVDEAFLDATHLNLKSVVEVERLGRQLKRHIASATGLTASVGLSHNKLLAKIASDYDKPDGLVCIVPDQVERVLNPLPIRRLPGIGPRTEQKLHASGILTIGQIRQAELDLLESVLGDGAFEIKEKAMGIDHRPVKPDRMRRSVSQETTFDQNQTRLIELKPHIKAQSQDVAQKLIQKGLWAKAVNIKIRSSGFSTITRTKALSDPTQQALVIEQMALLLFEEWAQWRPSFAIRLFGVGVMVESQRPQDSI